MINRPPRQAKSFMVTTCDDPHCGPHIVAEDERGHPICEIVVSCLACAALIDHLQEILSRKNGNENEKRH